MGLVRRFTIGLALTATLGASTASLAQEMSQSPAKDLVIASGPAPATISTPATVLQPAAVRPDRDGLADPEVAVSASLTPPVVASPPLRPRVLVKRPLAKLVLLPPPSAERPVTPRQRLRPFARLRLPALALLPLPPPVPAPRRTVTLTIAGDLGMGGHMQPVRSEGAVRQGSTIPWREWTDRIRPLIDGDLNFANLETAVTERNDLRAESKTFNFRSHPEGVRHIVGIGFNLLSTANNHSMDFGAVGAIDTVNHLDRIQATGRLKAHAGLGRNREEAGRAHVVEVADSKVAFSAVGIVTGGFPHHRAADNRPGQMAYQSPEDFADVTRRLADATAAYRILSVHHGIERQVQTDATALRKLRHEAVLGRGIDLVIGHHAHVVQGVEIVNGRLIFYGLGNFLHPGMQNMGSFGLCRDYGLFARLHLASDDTGHLRIRAVEVIALTDMHHKVSRMSTAQSAERVQVLNYLAGGLDDGATGARGLRFAAQSDGSGLYCADGAANDPGRIGKLCQNWRGPDVLNAAQRSRVASSCGYINQPPLETVRTPRPDSVAVRRDRRAEVEKVNSFSGN
ncbi:MAG: CapA family protein [Hyphomicrobiaceae bacterium]